MQFSSIAFAFAFALCFTSTLSHAMGRCELNGSFVDPNNGTELAGLTGLMRCSDQNTGKLQRERELSNGKFIGIDRFFDRDGRLLRERTLNERGNSNGTVKEFWPSGQMRRESNEFNGSTQGAMRSFYESGQLERVSYTLNNRQQANLTFSREGALTDIECHSASVLPEDRKPCGFEGKVRTTAFQTGRASSRISAIYTYEQGKQLAITTYREDGNIWAELAMQNDVRWHRVYDTRGAKDGKNILREERLYEAKDEPRSRVSDNSGRLQWSKLWGSNEQLIEHMRYKNGQPTVTERWYLNGSLKEKTSVSGEGTQARVQRENYDDQGRITSRENLMAQGSYNLQPTGVQQSFYATGKLAMQDTYSTPDERGRTRLLARKQWDETGKQTDDDEILEDGSRKRR